MNTYSHRTEIRVHRQPWLRNTLSVSLAVINVRDGARSVALAQPITLRQMTDDDMMREQPETFRLTPDDAQQFMDELWRAGIRPTEGAGSVGQLSAVNRHLEDMRALVFKKKA